MQLNAINGYTRRMKGDQHVVRIVLTITQYIRQNPAKHWSFPATSKSTIADRYVTHGDIQNL